MSRSSSFASDDVPLIGEICRFKEQPMSGSLSVPFKRQSAVSFSASTTNDGDDDHDAKVSRRVRNASSSNVIDQLSALDADALAALCDSDSSNSVTVPTVSPAVASLSAAMVASSSPPKALGAAVLSATPTRLRSTSHRTSFTFTADEPDDGIALLGHDAHKPRKWFSWLSRLKPGSQAPATAATAPAPAPVLSLSSSPSAATGGAAPVAAAAAKTAAALATPAPPPTVTDVITATSLDELPAEVHVYLNRAGLTDGQIREHWGMVMGIFQLVTKCRVDNAWKEEHKKKLGNPGRDYRGSTDNLLSAADPAKSYRIYHTSPLGHGGFGTVLRAVRLSDSLALAIKTMPNGTAKQKRENLWEIGLLKRAQHPCVVTFYEAFVWADAVWMVMERLDGGSLSHAVALCGGFREPHVARLYARALAGAPRPQERQSDVLDARRRQADRLWSVPRLLALAWHLDARLAVLHLARDDPLRAALDADRHLVVCDQPARNGQRPPAQSHQRRQGDVRDGDCRRRLEPVDVFGGADRLSRAMSAARPAQASRGTGAAQARLLEQIV
jgi:hypothetical protein